MARFETTKQNQIIPFAAKEKLYAKIFAHPARASMGQTFAGTGELVFEGELLELPVKWHPTGMVN